MATTTDHQMSLAVAQRGSSSHLNRPARQLVPAFLQKLYEMVNDPADQDLIRWSDTGDSFFVLDQERFASEVLGRWFKHKNFTSFVRQLNMYGFHKIPHLRQGVLRSDSDTDFWNFEHPHFLRGQPDLLCLIQRKKQAQTTGDDAHAAPAADRDASGNVAVGALSANQLLDINSIVNGIQAIKRHQAAISADLNELKSSNQHLWQEAMTAREKYTKHQDTINRILKFLAGVFGHGENQMRKDEDASHAVVARKPQRLMIADGRSGQKASVNEVVEKESRPNMESARSANSTDFLGQLDTLQQLIVPSPPQPPAINPGSGNPHPIVAPSPRLPSTYDFTTANALSPFTLSLLGSSSDLDPLLLQQQDDRLQKSYKSTAEINNDVDELQTNIQSLIQSLGIDPMTLGSVGHPTETATGFGGGGGIPAPPPTGEDMFPPGPGQDFDFDSFLMDMPRANEEDGDLDKLAERLDASTAVVPKVSDPSKIGSASSEQLHAFLDEVASQDGSEGGVPPLHGSQAFKLSVRGGPGAISGVGGIGTGAGTETRGRKRKSDVIVDGARAHALQGAQVAHTAPEAPPTTGTKSKRKR